MTGDELKEIRERMNLDRHNFAIHVIGYTGSDRNVEMRMRRLEIPDELVPLHIARLVWLTAKYLAEHNGHMPHWPANLMLEGETAPWM